MLSGKTPKYRQTLKILPYADGEISLESGAFMSMGNGPGLK